jgi:hypothetical protein
MIKIEIYSEIYTTHCKSTYCIAQSKNETENPAEEVVICETVQTDVEVQVERTQRGAFKLRHVLLARPIRCLEGADYAPSSCTPTLELMSSSTSFRATDIEHSTHIPSMPHCSQRRPTTLFSPFHSGHNIYSCLLSFAHVVLCLK